MNNMQTRLARLEATAAAHGGAAPAVAIVLSDSFYPKPLREVYGTALSRLVVEAEAAAGPEAAAPQSKPETFTIAPPPCTCWYGGPDPACPVHTKGKTEP